ncbi:FAD-dependent pyridine nucleotide-disulphide oxidoreductase [Kribbella flavida DSM 17836]|uniref:NADH:ubiquinone reductase (non-electrogenic) n=1 Tax=Kribbella flavida (strain DSM 17836 / JCM 10339 / NBRC 14399) TaxID=479435 RepID=D2Q4T6_KRIFD|nr:NAD(P)/FAD-dependent oxidoreductase [Kribbella flavida]ADB34191.1 FAD-dependent pyridine nucleotide-disulphide oxidoreductase [Kribbella flavida DSM 17836]
MATDDPERTAADRGARRPRVVVVGGGFGGLQVVRNLRRADVDVLLIDRTNHHLFQPLLYQVSTSLLAPGDIAPALRKIFAGQRNAKVLLGEATDVDPVGQTVQVQLADGTRRAAPYDHLVLATGSEPSYFGHPEWARDALPMKTIDQAVTLRNRLIHAFEAAAVAEDPDERREWMTFVVIGAGPTGVELAGQLAAMARRTLRDQFRDLDLSEVRVVLADGADSVLGAFPETLRKHTHRRLQKLGVEIVLGAFATDVKPAAVTFKAGEHEQVIHGRTILWTAGVQASPLTRDLAKAIGAETDRGGRVVVGPDCRLPGHPEIFVIGDAANVANLPGIAEPAMQEGKYVAKVIRHTLEGEPFDEPFKYLDLGTMATISPGDAVADIRGLRLKGVIGKLAWAAVHLAFLVGWGNRASVLTTWAATTLNGTRRQQVMLGGPTTRTPD